MNDAAREYVRSTLTPIVGDLRSAADRLEKAIGGDEIDCDEVEQIVIAPKNAARTLADVERYIRRVARREGRGTRVTRRERRGTGGMPKPGAGGPLTAPRTAPERLRVTLKGQGGRVAPEQMQRDAPSAPAPSQPGVLPPPPTGIRPAKPQE